MRAIFFVFGLVYLFFASAFSEVGSPNEAQFDIDSQVSVHRHVTRDTHVQQNHLTGDFSGISDKDFDA